MRILIIIHFFIICLFSVNLTGCAKIWSPVFFTGQKVDTKYYDKLPYYDGIHDLCRYEGRHVHDPDLGPITIQETSKKEILKEYRYPGMKDRFKELDKRVW